MNLNAPIAAAPARRAGAVSRLAAFLVDAVLLGIVLRGTSWTLLATQHAFRSFARPVNVAAIIFAAVPFVAAAYNVVFWRLYGQTPGKWLMGIKVVPLAGGGMRTRDALVRFFGYLVSALPFYLGFLWILGPARQGWHDRLAGTQVVYTPRRPETRIDKYIGGLAEVPR
jgi:uncharacterized RDD family membrane protein YckC